jgi:hypothetical protein
VTMTTARSVTAIFPSTPPPPNFSAYLPLVIR